MQKTFNRICIGIIIGLIICVMLLGYGYRYEQGRADEYLNALNRSQEFVDRIEDGLSAQAEKLHRVNIENSELRIEREKLRKEIFGIGEQISELGKIESTDFDRISRLEEIMDRIIAFVRGLQEKSGNND